MLEKTTYRPTIVYRPIQPYDLEALQQIHAALFPIRYELEFYLNVVNGNDIISWAAVDSQSNELVGFVTTRTIPSRESEIVDVLSCDSSRTDHTLVYILTLGVVEHYRNLGIASSLVQEVIKYASSVRSCRAVYLHVIDYNGPAIRFYKKLFKLVRRLSKFYYISGNHYDAYLFVYYVNGGRSTCSPLDFVVAVAAYLKSVLKLFSGKIWRSGYNKKFKRWSKCKEPTSLINTQSKRILGGDEALIECV